MRQIGERAGRNCGCGKKCGQTIYCKIDFGTIDISKLLQNRHIQNCESALDIWTMLANLHEEKGLSRKIALLRTLISSRLESESGMEAYVNKIIDTSNKLSSIGFSNG